LGGIGNAKAFDAVNAARKSNDPDICNAAVRALTVWPDATAVDTLLDIFASTKNPTHKALAFRGAVRLLSIPELDKGKALDGYKKLLAKAKQPGEIKLVLSGLSTIADPAALPMIRPYLSQKPVQKEATAALRKVSKALTVRPDDIIYTKFIKGVYGFEDQVVDVTSKIAARKNSAGTIDVTGKYNGLFGDPADREFKVLLITYELNGKQQTVKFIENTPFTMKLAGPKKADPPKKLSGEFKPLFDGKTLTGWKGRKSLWSVQDGAIVGQTSAAAALKHNDFLYTEKEYENFELTLSYKLVNHNSGVQIRSQVRDDFIITGYQADIAEKRYTGILYDEGRRGIIAKVKPEVVSKFIKPKEWNDYRIVCQGKEIKFWINGQPTISYTEKKASIPSKGVIAFQLHKGPPMKVLFKNIQIKELP
jgi:hypothetical protein